MKTSVRRQPHVLPLRRRSEVIHRVLKKRLGTVLPAAMRQSGFDMWLVLCQEDDWDPIHDTFCPMDPWRPILQMLIFSIAARSAASSGSTRRGGRGLQRRRVSAHPRAAEGVLSVLRVKSLSLWERVRVRAGCREIGDLRKAEGGGRKAEGGSTSAEPRSLNPEPEPLPHSVHTGNS